MKIGIIGAGISGLTAGKQLSSAGHEVKIFDKSRGMGGRMSTRRADEFAFDHGAQCFTARTKDFRNFVREYENKGVIKKWKGKVVSLEKGKRPTKRLWFETHFVSSPRMNSLCKAMAEGLDVNVGVEVKDINKTSNGWEFIDINGKNLGEFDWVICTAPPKQTVNLMPTEFIHKDEINDIKMYACFALMLGFKKQIKTNFMAARIRKSILKWVSIDGSKPDRNSDLTSIVIHSRDEWANENAECDKEEIKNEMISEFKDITEIDGNEADYVSIHRWLYSLVQTAPKAGTYIDYDNKLAACGDWCLTSRIEEAWISATKTANLIDAKL